MPCATASAINAAPVGQYPLLKVKHYLQSIQLYDLLDLYIVLPYSSYIHEK